MLGTAFRNFGDPKCRFGTVHVPATVHHAVALSCTAPSASLVMRPPGAAYASLAEEQVTLPQSCALQVLLNGVNFAKTSLRFWYYDLAAVHIASIHPSGGPSWGGTRVNITGIGFTDRGGLVRGPKCRFGDRVVPATVTASHEMRCDSPAAESAPDASVARVWISINGYADWRGLSGGNLTFRYGAPPTLSRVHPLGGPAQGGSRLTVHGAGIVDDGGAMDEAVVSLLHLAAPLRRRAKWPRLDLGVARPALLCLFGARGDELAMKGTLDADGSLLCEAPPLAGLRGGVEPVGGWCARQGHVHCRDPAYADAGFVAVPLRVTLNGNASQNTESMLPWLIAPSGLPSLTAVEPWGGPTAGGTNVTLIGDGLLDLGATRCRFNDMFVDAVVGGVDRVALSHAALMTHATRHDGRATPEIGRETGRRLTCVSPPMSDLPVGYEASLSVTLDGIHFSPPLVFRYTPDVTIISVFPTGGPVSGGTTLTVRGSALARLAEGGVLCAFGGANATANALRAVPGTLTDSRVLHCVSPPAHAPGESRLRLSINGALDDSSLSSTSLGFTYYDDVAVSSLMPRAGPSFGGITVTVRGAGLRLLGRPRCRFGAEPPVNATWPFDAAHGPAADGGATVDEFVCYAPRAGGHGPAAVEVSPNGQQFSTSAPAVPFVFEDPCDARGRLEYYDEVPGLREATLAHMAALGVRDWSQFDADADGRVSRAEHRAMLDYLNTSEAHVPADLDAALEAYARDSCAPPGSPGRAWSDDADVSYDETRAEIEARGGVYDHTTPGVPRYPLPYGPAPPPSTPPLALRNDAPAASAPLYAGPINALGLPGLAEGTHNHGVDYTRTEHPYG